MDRTALVIGATGGFGGATARALIAHGWRVRALHRDPDVAAAKTRLEAEWVAGDALDREAVRRAAEGAQVIVHGANPPGYRNWAGTVVPMMRATIAAGIAEGARILLPGNVYNYGPDAFPRLSETSPQHPLTRKGAIRLEMEKSLRRAAQDGAKVLILRAGDFFGPAASPGWMGTAMFRAGRPLKSIAYPGQLEVRHAWAYLPDLGEAAARLLDREAELSADASFHFAGHSLNGHELIAAFEQAVGHKLAVSRFPWLAVQAAGPFVETLRELAEMRYLWRETVLLDGTRLERELDGEPRSPLVEALRTTLAGMGCLEPLAAAA